MPEKHSAFGYSAVSCFEQCPFQYKCRYLDGLKTLPTDDPANALVIGTALHRAIETDIDTAIQEYFAAYPIITDQHIDEEIKLRHLVPKVKRILPQGIHEVQVTDTNFIGTLDLLVPIAPEEMTLEEKDAICDQCEGYYKCGECQSGRCSSGKYYGYYDLYDFKYTNNWTRYMHSRQLHLYKYYFEKTNPGKRIRNMYFLFVPKVQIRQKKTETLFDFRQRLVKELGKVEPTIKPIEYDPQKVIDHLEITQVIPQVTEYSKNPTRLCDWCDYKKYCQEGDLQGMALPSTQDVVITMNDHKKIWLYGEPFSGKTHLASVAPKPILELNTDGNLKRYTMPRISITDTKEGRQTIPAWEVFKNAVDDLAAGSDFKTIVLDLTEDIYDHCRKYMCDKRGWEHESDDSFKAYDIVRSEFLRVIRKLVNLPYNIILISHEDIGRDLTKRSGDKVTRIQPNIADKIAKKLAGMVDVVIRTVKDNDTYLLSTKTSDVIFGGGRLDGIKAVDVPNCWESIEAMYATVTGEDCPETHESTEVVETPTPTQENPVDATDEVMSRLKNAAESASTYDQPTEQPTEQPVRRTRRTRN